MRTSAHRGHRNKRLAFRMQSLVHDDGIIRRARDSIRCVLAKCTLIALGSADQIIHVQDTESGASSQSDVQGIQPLSPQSRSHQTDGASHRARALIPSAYAVQTPTHTRWVRPCARGGRICCLLPSGEHIASGSVDILSRLPRLLLQCIQGKTFQETHWRG